MLLTLLVRYRAEDGLAKFLISEFIADLRKNFQATISLLAVDEPNNELYVIVVMSQDDYNKYMNSWPIFRMSIAAQRNQFKGEHRISFLMLTNTVVISDDDSSPSSGSPESRSGNSESERGFSGERG